nr:ketopantoate reductase family protein [Treponema sp.]
MIKNVAIIGLGAVGAVLANQLEEVLKDNLFCILDDDRRKLYQEKEITINGQKQNFNYVSPADVKEVDLVIIATKNLQLDQALKEIKNAVGKNTAILSLLNGIQSEKEIEKIYGPERTLYGFIINLESINLDRNITCTAKGQIVFGEKDNKPTKRIKEIEELFNKAKVSYKIPQNIQFEMWKKFLINTVFNSLGAICRSPYGGFKNQVLQDLARKIGNEVIQVANAEKIPLTKELLEEDIKLTCSYTESGKCSMLQDMEARRKSENPFFCGTIMELGKKHNIPTPYCEFLYQLIDASEKV